MMAGALEILEPIAEQENVLPLVLQQYANFMLEPSNPHPNPDAALKHVLRADRLEHHGNPETLEILAHAYYAAGDLPHAHETAAQALSDMPAGGDPDVRRKLEHWLASSKR
jgi:hypothetical protein